MGRWASTSCPGAEGSGGAGAHRRTSPQHPGLRRPRSPPAGGEGRRRSPRGAGPAHGSARRVSEKGHHGESCGQHPSRALQETSGGSGGGVCGARGSGGSGTDLLLLLLLLSAAPGRVPRRYRDRDRVRVRRQGQEEPRLPEAPCPDPGLPQPLPAARGCSRPQHVRRDLARSGQKAHLLRMFGWFRWDVLGFFSLFSLHLRSQRRKQSPVPASRARRRRARSSGADRGSGANPAAARRAAPAPPQLGCTHLPVPTAPTVGSGRSLWELPGTWRGRQGRGRQAQAAPAPPLRLPPLRLPFYIHLPTAGGARTVYGGGAAGSSQPGTFPPARTYICDRRADAPLPAREGLPRLAAPGPAGSVSGSPRLCAPGGAQQPHAKMRLGASCLSEGRELSHPSSRCHKAGHGSPGPSWETADPLAPSRVGVSPCAVLCLANLWTTL